VPVQVKTASENNPDLNLFNGLSEFIQFSNNRLELRVGFFQGGLIRSKAFEITADTSNRPSKLKCSFGLSSPRDE